MAEAKKIEARPHAPVKAAGPDAKAGKGYTLNLFKGRVEGANTVGWNVVLLVKLDFWFMDETGGSWTTEEVGKWKQRYRTVIKHAWGVHNGKTPRGIPVSLFIKLDTEASPSSAHWSLYVSKVGRKEFVTSGVNFTAKKVYLDSNDVFPIQKSVKSSSAQIPAAHEFGHMIGLDDEYKFKHRKNPNETQDHSNIMHTGGAVRDKHLLHVLRWLDDVIAAAVERDDGMKGKKVA